MLISLSLTDKQSLHLLLSLAVKNITPRDSLPLMYVKQVVFLENNSVKTVQIEVTQT